MRKWRTTRKGTTLGGVPGNSGAVTMKVIASLFAGGLVSMSFERALGLIAPCLGSKASPSADRDAQLGITNLDSPFWRVSGPKHPTS